MEDLSYSHTMQSRTTNHTQVLAPLKWTCIAKGTGLLGILGIKVGAFVHELPEYWQLDEPNTCI